MAKKKYKPSKGDPSTLDAVLAQHPNGRDLAVMWARVQAVIRHDESYKKWIEAFDADEYRPLEEYCKIAGITAGEFYGMFARHMKDYVDQTVEVIKFAEFPKVVKASYQAAQDTENGFADRTAILKQEGFHHAPQGNQIHINQGMNVQGAYQDMNTFMTELDALGTEPRQLPEATQEFVDGAIVHEDEKELVER